MASYQQFLFRTNYLVFMRRAKNRLSNSHLLLVYINYHRLFHRLLHPIFIKASLNFIQFLSHGDSWGISHDFKPLTAHIYIHLLSSDIFSQGV